MKFLHFLKNLFFGKNIIPKKRRRRLITDDEYNELRLKRQNRLNQILDKINSKGIDSLNQDEKNFLDRYYNV